MNEELIYSERVSSPRTGAFFVALMVLFFSLFVRRVIKGVRGVLTAVFLFMANFFLFYALNYRTLIIRLNNEALMLTFGLFSWTVPVDNIAACRLDDIPFLMRIGGAGIHFMLIDNRYRASFNFLDHPRVVITLREKAGPVQDISFSTRRPEKLVRLITEALPMPVAPIY